MSLHPLSSLKYPALFTLGVLLAACQSMQNRPSEVVRPDPRLTPAHREMASDDALPKVVEVKVPVASPQLRPLPVASSKSGTVSGPQAIADAKAAATTQPSAGDFLNAIQY